jgi:UDP-N-acetylmuramyl pentapeptide phosphotransferase/UDP-N-acetylglucosamine-1-phosphate transferase
VLVSVAALLGLYAALPLEGSHSESPAVLLVAALAVVGAVLTLQIRAIMRSHRPRARAVEALATSIPLLILTFASIYVVMSNETPSSFTETLDRTDALYFAVTVLSTVGFGDITPTTDATRGVVTVQMIVNLLVLGIGLRVVLGAVQRGEERQGGRRTAAEVTPEA